MRYVYLGDKHTRLDLEGRPCDPVLRPDRQVIRGRNRNQLVVFDTGERAVVAGRFLRLQSKLKA